MPELVLPGSPTASVTPTPFSRLLHAACLALGVLAWCRLGPAYGEILKPGPEASPDFYQDWASARNFRIGMPVYSRHEFTMPIHLGREQQDWEQDIQYNAHPPTSVLLAMPFSYLNLPEAVLAWNLLTIAALIGALGIVAASLPELRTLFLPVAVFLPFCLPIYGNFQQGQLTLVLVLLTTAAWALERSERPIFAGILIGAAASVKLFPAYLLVYLAARRQWRGVLAAGLTMALLAAVTAAVLGISTYRDYGTIVLPSLERFRSYAFNHSFAGFWHKLFDPSSERGWVAAVWPSPVLARWGTIVSDVIITAMVSAHAYRARSRDSADLAFAMTATAMLLVSPITWDYSLPMLIVPIAVAARSAMTAPWLGASLLPILIVFGLPQSTLLAWALAHRTPGPATPGFILGMPSLVFYAMAAMFVALTVRAAGVVKSAPSA